MGLDGVEIVMAWEESFDIAINDMEAGQIRTPRMAIDLICRRLGVPDNSGGICLSQRVFYRVRRAFAKVLSSPRALIAPRVRLADVIPSRDRRRTFQALATEVGVPFPKLLFGFGYGDLTIGEFSQLLVANHASRLLAPTDPWTRPQVREVVRAVVSSHLGIRGFSDDADFVTDLRVD